MDDFAITIHLRSTDHGGNRSVVYPFPIPLLRVRPVGGPPSFFSGFHGDNEIDKQRIRTYLADSEKLFGAKLADFIEATRSLRSCPGMLERAANYWESVSHLHHMVHLGASINVFAQGAGLCKICPEHPSQPARSPSRHQLISPEITPVPEMHHLCVGTLPTLDVTNPFHFLAILACTVQGAWAAQSKECILRAIGRDNVVEVLLEYLEHETKLGGLRWYGPDGLRMENLVPDAIVFALRARDMCDYRIARSIDRMLSCRYSV